MAYIPPHKRHSSSSSAPESLLPPHFRKNLSLSDRNSNSRSTRKDKGSKLIYADNAISKWFGVGLPNSDKEDESSRNLSAVTRFEPVSLGSFAKKSGETPLVLVLKDVKGGLRWPLGKDTLGDRFDFRTSSGEVSGEVILKMHRVVALMQKQTFENDKVVQLLGDDLKFIWDHFMCINK